MKFKSDSLFKGFLVNSIKGNIFRKRHYLDGKEKPENRKNRDQIRKRKEETRESEK